MDGSSDEEAQRLLEDELRELREVLGIHYQPERQRGTQAGRQDSRLARLAEEWQAIGEIADQAGSWEAEEAALRLREPADAATRNTAPDAEPTAVPSEERQQGAIEHALQENRLLQRRLRAGLQSLERAAARVGSLQVAVEALHRKYRGSKPGSLQTEVTGKSRFWNAEGRAPEPNADTKALLPAYQYLPHVFATPCWTDVETKTLEGAVLTVVQDDLFNAELAKLAKQPSEQSESQPDVSAISDRLKGLTAESSEVREAAEQLSDTQWAKVARLAGGKRSVADCRTRWSASLAASPDKPWSADEDAALLAIAQRHDYYNWPDIAKELDTGRHASACLARYQTQLKRGAATGSAGGRKWTPEEDERLRQAVARHGRNWQAIAAEVGGGRTAPNVLQRWSRRGVGVTFKKGRWSKDEDESLLRAVGLEGRKWSMVARHVEGRSDVQCRERYMNVLDPSLNPNPWTAEEDEKLLQAVLDNTSEDGAISWAGVAAAVPGRTDNVVHRRYQALCKGLKPGEQSLKPGRPPRASGKGRGKKKPAKRKREESDTDEPGENPASDT